MHPLDFYLLMLDNASEQIGSRLPSRQLITMKRFGSDAEWLSCYTIRERTAFIYAVSRWYQWIQL